MAILVAGCATAPLRAPARASAGVRAAAASANHFAGAMYQQLASAPGNFVFSPSSISLALAMAYAGAQGETAAQMRETLFFGGDADALHAANEEQLAAWNDPKRRSYELAVANRLFGEKTAEFVPSFIQLTGEHYGAPLELMDFREEPDACRKAINAWIEARTNRRIEALLPAGSIDADTRLVLINAIYFKGMWQYEFDERHTEDAEFETLAGARVQVPMMHTTAKLRYAELQEMGRDGPSLPSVGLSPPVG